MSVPEAEAAWFRARLGTAETRKSQHRVPEGTVQPEQDRLGCGPQMNGPDTELVCDCRAAAMGGIDRVESPDGYASLSDTNVEVAMHGAPR